MSSSVGPSAPRKGDLLQPPAADARVGAGDGPATTPPIEIARRRVVDQRPHHQARQLAHVEHVPAALEQVLAEPQALIDRIEVELENLALKRAALPRGAER